MWPGPSRTAARCVRWESPLPTPSLSKISRGQAGSRRTPEVLGKSQGRYGDTTVTLVTLNLEHNCLRTVCNSVSRYCPAQTSYSSGTR